MVSSHRLRPHPPGAVSVEPPPRRREGRPHPGRPLTGLMEHMQGPAVPEVFITSEGNYGTGHPPGPGPGGIIGRRVETLTPSSMLTATPSTGASPSGCASMWTPRANRAKRRSPSSELAVKVAGKVVKYRKNMALEPMNA